MSQTFKSIFPDEGMAAELRDLAMKMSCTKVSSNYVYSRQELIDILEEPSFEEYRAQYVANLKQQAHVHSWIEDFERGRENKLLDSLFSSASRRNNGPMSNNNGNKKDLSRPRDDRYKNPNAKSSPLNWRSGGMSNNGNNMNDRSYEPRSKTGYDRLQSNNARQNNGRSNGRPGYGLRQNYYEEEDEEEEPEWMTDGPDSMLDFIELKGFDDDPLNEDGFFNTMSSNENLSIAASSTSDRRDSIRHHENGLDMDPCVVSSTTVASSESDLFNRHSTGVPSFFGESSNGAPAMGSSRAAKWFKKTAVDSSSSAATSSSDIIASAVRKTAQPTVASVQNLMDRMKAGSGGGLPPPPNRIDIDFSKATSLADLEAEMFPSSASTTLPEKSARRSPTLDPIKNLPRSGAPSPQLSTPFPGASSLHQQPPAFQQQQHQQQLRNAQQNLFQLQQNTVSLMMQQIFTQQQMTAFRNLPHAHQIEIYKQMADRIQAQTPMINPGQRYINPEMVQQQMAYQNLRQPMAMNPGMTLPGAQFRGPMYAQNQFGGPMGSMQDMYRNLPQQHPSANPSPKPSEVTANKTEKLLKNSTLTPTAVFRKTLKAGDQASKSADKAAEPVDRLSNLAKSDSPALVSPLVASCAPDLPNIAPKTNPLSLFSSFNGSHGPKLPMPMPGKAFTLDDIEKM